MIKLLSIPVGSFTGIKNVWNFATRSTDNQPSFVVGGYYGNKFAIIDVSNGYEFFNVDTGGRQRMIDVGLRINTSKEIHASEFTVAICVNGHDQHHY